MHPSSAWAFKLKHHGAISHNAFQLLRVQGKLVGVDDRYERLFARGSKHEDSPLRWVPKLFNQHFYRAGWKPEHCRSTLLRRFDRLDARLEKALTRNQKRRAWRTAGKLAHYLQDMNCPPHVMPVYHARKDRFDQTALPAFTGLNLQLLATWTPLAPRALLDAVSMHTVQSITTPLPLQVNGKNAVLDWSLFWSTKAHTKDRSFGTYGDAGNAWGTLEPFTCAPRKCCTDGTAARAGHCCPAEPRPTYLITAATYAAYQDARVRGACTASAVLIQYVSGRLP